MGNEKGEGNHCGSSPPSCGVCVKKEPDIGVTSVESLLLNSDQPPPPSRPFQTSRYLRRRPTGVHIYNNPMTYGTITLNIVSVWNERILRVRMGRTRRPGWR